MITRLWGFGIVVVVCAAAVGCVTYTYPPASTEPVVTAVAPPPGSDQPFYEDLAPYGRWVNVSGPGWVWSPYNMQADWRPYQQGHWVYTDYGWTWASEEQWGPVVYHYGRWDQDPSYGWIWKPGTEWGPAWVAWHEGAGYVGWSPLPWQVGFHAGIGLDWGGVSVSVAPSSWCFVPARALVEPGMRHYIMPTSRNGTLIQVTRNVTNYTYVDNRVINQGVRVDKIGRAAGHTIPKYRVAEASTPAESSGGKVRGEEFVVYRPDPSHGRNSQGKGSSHGHDEAYQRGHSQASAPQPASSPVRPTQQTAPAAVAPPAPPVSAQAPMTPLPGMPAPAAPAPAATAPATQTTPAPAQQSDERHGRAQKFSDGWVGSKRSPQGAKPAQATAPVAPAASAPAASSTTSAPAAASATPAPPATSTPAPAPAPTVAPTPSAAPAPAAPPKATAAPASPAPKATPARTQPERGRGKGHKNDAPKSEKPKDDAPKPAETDSGK